MDKEQIRGELHALVWQHLLFNETAWRILDRDPEAQRCIHRKFMAWGLLEPAPGLGADAFVATALGQELEVDLMSAFLGHADAWEVPERLREHGLLGPGQADELVERFENGADPVELLLPLLRKFYRQCYGAPRTPQ